MLLWKGTPIGVHPAEHRVGVEEEAARVYGRLDLAGALPDYLQDLHCCGSPFSSTLGSGSNSASEASPSVRESGTGASGGRASRG